MLISFQVESTVLKASSPDEIDDVMQSGGTYAFVLKADGDTAAKIHKFLEQLIRSDYRMPGSEKIP